MSALGDLIRQKREYEEKQGKTPLNQLSPDDQALLWGTAGYTPGYDSNDQGSFERNYNQQLQQFSPEELIKRYGDTTHGGGERFQTQLDQAGYQLYNTFKSMFGRDITASEYAQLAPYFQGPNGIINGQAAVANLQNQYKANPRLDPSNALNHQKPEDVKNSITNQFQSIAGRAPTQDELDFFSQKIKSGETSPYELGLYLKQQPEYTNAQDASFRQGLNSELQKYDTQEFNREKGDVISAYGRNGMAAGFDGNGNSLSPSLDYALTDLMGKIASNRSAYLAQLSASQYGGNKQLAQDNYQNTLNQMYSANQDRTNRMNNLSDTFLNRGFQGADYQTQKNDYEHMLSQIPSQKPNFFDYLNTGMGVANTAMNIGRGFSQPSPTYNYY